MVHPAPDRRLLPDVPGYLLEASVAQGGMGVVYRATAVADGRTVALKVLRPDRDTESLRERFSREGELASALDHDGIARVLGHAATSDGRPVVVMEFVDGEPIDDYCRSNRCSLDERLELLADVCDAVQHAHDRGWLHRDLKPANVLVERTPDGRARPRVVDFGLARPLDPGGVEPLTECGELVGTPEYLSPEAFVDAGAVDGQHDVWALGVLLHELVTGCRPFVRPTRDLDGLSKLVRIVRDRPAPLPSRTVDRAEDGGRRHAERCRMASRRALSARLRNGVDAVVATALERERCRRYADPRALAEAVRDALAVETSGLRPVRAAWTAWRGSFVAAAAVVMLAFVQVLAIGIGGGVASAWPWTESTRPADSSRTTVAAGGPGSAPSSGVRSSAPRSRAG